ncbi:MAG: hypothetical protein HY961_13160 [Ignavibacteriae bacterium]|nr:hypothetical protein [Ignavibacteriota bacterium]
MKILLDENLPHMLRFDLGAQHEVYTVDYMGWIGKKNGELLGLMTWKGFEALITADKNLEYQQNLDKFPIVVFLLRAHDNLHPTLQPLARLVSEMIDKGEYQRMNIIE